MEMRKWKHILIPYEQTVEELKVKFRSIRNECRQLDEYSPIEFVTGRVKSISSIIEKAKKKNISLDEVEDKIEDIAGIRIMCQFVGDIYKVVEIIRNRDGKDLFIVEERDYIEHMKKSGYRSFHMIIKYPIQTALGEKIVFAEIQIRTLAMNFWATIEHSLKYKYKKNMPKHIEERISKAAEAAYLLDKEMAEIREEVMKAQKQFQMESSVIADIFESIKSLTNLSNSKEMNDLYETFWQLWEDGNIDELQRFSRKIDMLAEVSSTD